MRHAKDAKEVERRGEGDSDPKGQKEFALNPVLLPHHVGGAQEFKGECQLEESQRDLDGIEPSARLGQALQPPREGCKQHKRKRQREAESKHSDGGTEELTAHGSGHEQLSDKWAGAAKAYQGEGERHKEDSEQAAALRLIVSLVDPRRRKRDFKRPKKADGKHHK